MEEKNVTERMQRAGEAFDSNTMLCLWVIYAQPRDFPNGYVVRRQWILPNEIVKETSAEYAPSLETARRRVPGGLYRLPPLGGEDLCIAEVWI